MTDLPTAMPPADDRQVPSDVRSLARGGGVNLVGAAGSAVFTFAAFVVAARLHSPAEVGAFTVAISVFTILTQVAMAGAQVGFTRFIARDLADGHPERVPTTLRVGLVPVLLVGVAGAVVAWLLGDVLAGVLGGEADGALVTAHLRWMAPVIPLAAAFLALAFASQGLGTMVPAAATDKLGRSALQLALIGGTGWAGARWLGLAWAAPYVLGAAVLAVWVRALLRRQGALHGADPMPRPEARRRFWSFAAPRGVASTLQVTILWADTIIIGALRGAEDAGVYAIATRFLVVGSLVIAAVLQVTGPRISKQLGRDDTVAVQATYRTATWSVVWLVWPLYLVLATLPEPLLRLFGPEYLPAAPTVTVLALAMCVGAACGPVDVLLLMSGRSWLSLGNWAAALVVDLGLALLLIGPYGILGAAIAWAASIVVRNVGPLFQVRHLLRVDPFGRGYVRATVTAAVVFGLGGLAARTTIGPSVLAIVVLLAVGLPVYGAVLWRWRHGLYVGAPS